MIHIDDIIKKLREINSEASVWGYTNPRFFKNTNEKTKDAENSEKIVLNILVDYVDARASTDYLKQSLELLLGCCVEVYSSDIDDDDLSKDEEAVPLSDKNLLIQYYGNDYQFTALSKEQLAELHNNSDSIYCILQTTLYGRKSLQRKELLRRQHQQRVPIVVSEDDSDSLTSVASNNLSETAGMKRRR